jgi:hypothetical protein
MKKIIAFVWGMMAVATAFPQTDSTAKRLQFSGYLEAYYGFDGANPGDHTRPGFMYSFNRHNEMNLNLGMVKAAYARKNIRGNLALMAGTYANANLAAEPATLRNVLEANAGVKISKNRNLWVDGGVFPSHIGFESAIGKDCWNLTRSMLADNSPYFESGAKVTYISANEKWTLSGMVLNGWQRITRPDGNNMPAFGHQITWKPSAKVTLNSSSFVGNDKPDSVRQMRYFHNFYGLFQFNDRLGATVGFDIGAEQAAKGSSDYNIWYSPVVIVRARMTNRLTLAARGEYYADPDKVIIASALPHGFQSFGYSLNADVAVQDNFVWRIEGRGLNSQGATFVSNGKRSNTYFFMTTSFAVSF